MIIKYKSSIQLRSKYVEKSFLLYLRLNIKGLLKLKTKMCG